MNAIHESTHQVIQQWQFTHPPSLSYTHSLYFYQKPVAGYLFFHRTGKEVVDVHACVRACVRVNGQWSMVNGQWSMINGQWSLVTGHWSMVNGQWSLVTGQWSMVNGQWSMVNGQWSMVNGQWSMVNGQ